MVEGWYGDDYFVLFDEDEIDLIGSGYQIGRFLPTFSVCGLRGWDDFVVRSQAGGLYTVPTVPVTSEHLKPATTPLPSRSDLKPDKQLAGKIKWYVRPIAFGGAAEPGDNLTWVSLKQHQQLVCWWNKKYREVSGGV